MEMIEKIKETGFTRYHLTGVFRIFQEEWMTEKNNHKTKHNEIAGLNTNEANQHANEK